MGAYKELYDRYAKAMYNTALRIVNSAADAEDILQEAFIDAFRQLRKFENRSTFGAWFKQIVVNKSISFLKRKKINFSEVETAGDVADAVDEDSIWYTVEMIKDAVQQLPDGYRAVLSLHLFEGYEQEEIAETLGLAHSTVRTQYMRGKQRLITLLKTNTAHEQQY